MTVPNSLPDPEPGLDGVVRSHLDAEAARTDPHGLAVRVLERLSSEPSVSPVHPPRTLRRTLLWVGAVALAASVVIGVFVLTGPREAAASPADVVRAARDCSDRNETRCYRLLVERSPKSREAFPVLVLDRGPRTLCTRGDRFFVEPGFGGTGAWGRDETGRVWFAPTEEAAAAFDEAELPQSLRVAVKVLELELPSLLDEVLVDFDLVWSEPPDPGSETYSITATRRGAAPPFGLASAELVIQKDTKILHTLTLHRRGAGEHTAALVFALQPSVPRTDAAFTPEGHLRAGAPIYDRTKLLSRQLLIAKQIGDKLANAK